MPHQSLESMTKKKAMTRRMTAKTAYKEVTNRAREKERRIAMNKAARKERRVVMNGVGTVSEVVTTMMGTVAVVEEIIEVMDTITIRSIYRSLHLVLTVSWST